MKRYSFPKSKRLVSNKQFKAVLSGHLRFSNGLLTLYVAKNTCGHSRLGVSIKKSCGGAVVRNRLKRLLREAFRQSQEQIPSRLDYLVMMSPPLRRDSADSATLKQAIKKLSFEQIRASLLKLTAEAEATIR